VFVQFWTHTNTDPKLGRLAWLFVTPAYHRVHHAADIELQNGNFGLILTIWDRMFGTYLDPAQVPANFELGLGDAPPARARLFAGV
jgi:sterol desaturase/sphingolipid hydroxylase (fatty acid hydroxylase superfamily)